MMRRLVNAYTYRTDANGPSFDDSTPLIIFDGECVLCSGGVQWMIARDPQGDAKFAAIQEPVPRALYTHYQLDPDAFDTFMVLVDGVPYLRWRGLCAAARLMPAPWKWLGALGRIVPDFNGDAIYDFVQRNRIGWFGKRDACLAPDEAMRSRFLTPAQ
jgi:predicted DCC family thiol-disulfide oxidoreductase YuxK